ncbi:hypothetical protein Vqi01_15130 [Micromonospora qiuiae]|uniref:acetyl-CoA C-acetyltransferase n=1 Tax=Micromonospora qiuiae TaxID=502268 RepID=A0ABQ4J863_9ACTN|nr:hypothetical protein [Micromonospora qiuiae]GIJ26351.1 hypothetical protein Vqi01_15130 [Micromonospora qiuiae]
MVSSEKILLVEGARTPVGSFGGAFKDVPAHELGATAVREALSRAGVPAEAVDEVVMGCIGQVGPDAYNGDGAGTDGLRAGAGAEATLRRDGHQRR